MTITSITSLGSYRYTVTDDRPETQTVDVRAWNYNGKCTCATFTGCCLYLLTNQPDPRQRQRCDHIIAVREWIMENDWPTLAEHAEKIIELPTTHDRHLADTGLDGG